MRVREPMLAANLAASTANEIAPGPTAVEERLNKAIDALLLCVDGFVGPESLIKS